MTSKVLISRKLIKTQVCNSKYSILNPGNKVAWCKKKRIVSPSVISNSVTPWTVARQAPLSTGFSRQEYWIGLPFPSPGDLPDPGSKPRSPALQTYFFTIWATRALRCIGWVGHAFERALGVGDGQGSLVCCSPWGHKESDTAESLNWTEAEFEHCLCYTFYT